MVLRQIPLTNQAVDDWGHDSFKGDPKLICQRRQQWLTSGWIQLLFLKIHICDLQLSFDQLIELKLDNW